MLSFPLFYSILTNHLHSKNKGQERDKQQSPNFTRDKGRDQFHQRWSCSRVSQKRKEFSFIQYICISCLPCPGVVLVSGDAQMKYTGPCPQDAGG